MIEYWFERFVLSPLIPAGVLLALAAAWPGTADALAAWWINLPSALLLLAQFRLWDDLADRKRDQRDHPERVLCTRDPSIFVATTVLLAAVNLWMVFSNRSALTLLLLLALNAAAIGFYRWRPSRRTVVSDALLLLKYPAILLVLADFRPDRFALGIALLATYGTALAYEIWHDAASPLRFNNL